MTVWLKQTTTPGFLRKPINLDLEPSPTVTAGGIAGGSRSQYFIVDDEKESSVRTQEKLPYRVPSMEEIGALPWNGFRVISTFAGCGGSSLGYRMAGFRVLWANEFIPAARECYLLNARPGTIVNGTDIRKLSPEQVMEEAGIARGELDVFDGSPPCASFSTMGKREAGWGKVKKYSDSAQRTDDLFFEYARMIDGIQPKVFVAENVSGLVKGTAKGYFKEILARLKGCGEGYVVEAKLLDAQWLGVPQARQRLIFMGVRRDLGKKPVFPRPLSFRYSVRDAIPWITRIRGRTGPHYTVVDSEVHLPMNTIIAEEQQARFEVECDISRYAIGEEWDKLSPGQHSERFFNLVKPDPGKP